MRSDQPFSIDDFFESYRDAFARFDAVGIADHYTDCAQIVDNNGIFYSANKNALEQQISGYCERFAALGYKGASNNVKAIRELGAQCVFVDVQWTVALSQESLSYGTAYVIYRQADGWKITSAIVY